VTIVYANCTHQSIYHTGPHQVLPVLNIPPYAHPHPRTPTPIHIHTTSSLPTHLTISETAVQYPYSTQFGISDLNTGTLLHGSTFSVTAFTFTFAGFRPATGTRPPNVQRGGSAAIERSSLSCQRSRPYHPPATHLIVSEPTQTH
jgi:hypothetical protein